MEKIFPFRNMKKITYLKYEKFHLQISSRTVHKNNLFLELNVHYFRSSPKLIFYQAYVKFQIYLQMKFFILQNGKKLPFCFSYDRKNLLWSHSFQLCKIEKSIFIQITTWTELSFYLNCFLARNRCPQSNLSTI